LTEREEDEIEREEGRKSYRERSKVNFTNILPKAFTPTDPKNAK